MGKRKHDSEGPFRADLNPRKKSSRFRSRQVARGFVGAAGDAKFVDASIAQAAVGTTATVQHISIVPQDNTVNGRNGRAFRCKNVRIRYRVNQDSTAQINTVRCALVWDYQPNKALAAFTDIFDSASVDAFPKRENNMRFKIVRDMTHTLSGNSTLATSTSSVQADEFLKLPRDANCLLTAADTTGVIGDVIQGALLFVTVGTAGAGTNDAQLSGNSRVNFTERLSSVSGSSRMRM